CADCEIIIVTDGEDNMSTGLFHGPTGFDELMLKLKERNQPLPRVGWWVFLSGRQRG
ncbi:unnamed protein product, partial [Rotaria magnacalcarata]